MSHPSCIPGRAGIQETGFMQELLEKGVPYEEALRQEMARDPDQKRVVPVVVTEAPVVEEEKATGFFGKKEKGIS